MLFECSLSLSTRNHIAAVLRVEKSKKDHQINVCLRERESYFSKLFLKAFALALAIHLGGYLLFRIQPFKADSNYIFPPIQVISQAKLESSSVIVEHAPEEDVSFPIALFKPAPQYIPEPPDIFSINPSEENNFASFEREIPSVSIPIEMSYTPLQIYVSGQLSKRKLLEGPYDLLRKPERTTKREAQTYHIAYQVQINPDSGLIFWYDKMLSSPVKEIDKQIEKVLLDLRFEANSSLEGVKGQIDFFVTHYD